MIILISAFLLTAFCLFAAGVIASFVLPFLSNMEDKEKDD